MSFYHKEVNMAAQPRAAKVLAALLVSMTMGVVVLLALGNNPPSAGPFCLASYYRLNPIEQAIDSQATQYPDRWESIEIYYSGTKAGNISQLASLKGLPSADSIDCHFVLGNGKGAEDGQILTTYKWVKQWSIIPGDNWYGNGQTIRICIIAAPPECSPTDFQIKRSESLVSQLAQDFQIPPNKIYFPGNWR
jgi:hypothetical protein